jgi:hypothetical protein
MVKIKNKGNSGNGKNKGNNGPAWDLSKINASTHFDFTNERITAFGGVFALVKFVDAVDFKELFEHHFLEPRRKPRMGCFKMFYGLLILLFIGFTRLHHFQYIREDPLLCRLFGRIRLPDQSVFWRFLNSFGIHQAHSLQKIISVLRERTWRLLDLSFHTIHVDIDTTVKSVFGQIQGGRVCYNTQRRGQKGLRPILSFISETREFVYGYLRQGKTVSGKEFVKYLKHLKRFLPSQVKRVILRADSEFMSGPVCCTADNLGFGFIFSNKQCEPPFPKNGWYKPKKKDFREYNECIYHPKTWEKPFRFVAMRISKNLRKKPKNIQLPLFYEDSFEYRIFVTNLKGKPHDICKKYDRRADAENLIGEAKQEGVDAIPSKKFKNNAAFFQLVLLVFNLWRYLKLFAVQNPKKNPKQPLSKKGNALLSHPFLAHKARIARLKLLFLSAKIGLSNFFSVNLVGVFPVF